MPEHILSLSYGKDSLACLFAIEELGWLLDRIVHAEVWATDTIPADLPPMVEFKAKADKIIKERWGIEVEHYRAKYTFKEAFYLTKGRTGRKSKFAGYIYGWPRTCGSWCLQQLKRPVFNRFSSRENVQYLGIACDEPNRFKVLNDRKKSPLKEVGWDEAHCRQLCEENELLSPAYNSSMRSGCWFCPKQPTAQLRLLRNNYPEYWNMMLNWDLDSHFPFRADGHTVHDFERRFALEDAGWIMPDERFKWSYLDKQQIDVFSLLRRE